MRRCFMTIPEACQLVLQAGVIGKAGQICVLDMGEPVRIVDLARNLILLSGLSPGRDIKIEFTGMRPGEKLYEELSGLLENTVPSGHAKIHIFVGSSHSKARVHEWLHAVREICQHRDVGRLLVKLKEFVPEYNPSIQLMRMAINPLVQHGGALHRPAPQFSLGESSPEAKAQIA
jgi:FlaA1/EpsC-like NDP-sugar epimerase